MFNKDKAYTLKELLDNFGMMNIEFKFYGNNENGDLILYMKTDTNEVSVFSSINKQTKYDYLNFNEEEAKEIKFRFDRRVEKLNLDIAVIVLKTSDINIPSGRYSLDTLNKLSLEQEQDEKNKIYNFKNGFCYTIIDNNNATTIYDGIYMFGDGGFINDLKNNKIPNEKNKLRKQNAEMILDYFNLKYNQKEGSLEV